MTTSRPKRSRTRDEMDTYLPTLENLEPRLMLNGAVVISEFMAANDTTLADYIGDYPDWLELHNTGAVDVDLDGWHLTDDPGDLTKWTIPAVNLPAGGFLVIFTSDKDRDDPAAELHTNFKLKSAGEYLALVQPDGVTIAHDYAPAQQYNDISYGLMADGSLAYFDVPTPGAANDGWPALLPEVLFSVPHGFYDQPFDVELGSGTPNAIVYYTLDGTDPYEIDSSWIEYTGPITIDASTVVRAYAETTVAESPTKTQTYIFIDSVLNQGDDQTAIGFPDIWEAGAGGSGIYDSEFRDADYEMDPDIVNHSIYGPQMTEALMSLPSMSLVVDPEDLWDPETGIYPNSIQRASRDDMWEKAASLELIDPDGGEEFTINAGARMFGELARWAAVNDKQSFRIVFQEEWGPTKLTTSFFGDPDVNQYDTIVLRSHWGKSWLNDELLGQRIGVGWLNGDPTNAQYLRDLYALETFADTGNLSSDGRFVHLYLNGLYWGLFEVIERPDNSFNAEHLGGDKEDFNVVKGAVGDSWNVAAGRYVKNPEQNGRLQDGSREMWDWLFDTYFDARSNGINRYGVRNNISDSEFAEISKYLDIDQFIDYMITLWTLNRGDFPRKNWYAVWEGGGAAEVPGTPIQFYVWDSEASLDYNVWSHPDTRWNPPSDSNDTGPVRMYWRLITNADFRDRWTDRANELLGYGGPLSAEAMIERYAEMADQIDMAVIAESARWGDSAELHVNDPMTKADWDAEYEYIVSDWLLERSARTLGEMQSEFGGLSASMHPDYDPNMNAPLIADGGGIVQPGFQTWMLNPNFGGSTLWYTLDGSDPVGPDGNVGPTAMLYETLEGFGAAVLTPGAEWLYDDTGADLGAAWRDLAYDDSAWQFAPGQFGYGDGDETTVISYGGDPQNKNTTTYFRNYFHVEAAAAVGSLTISVLRDDGIVVYLNGAEVLRDNMPDGPVSYDTPADETISRGGEATYYSFTLEPAALVDGDNVIAVEVHQDSPGGSDLSFDLTMDMVTAGLGTSPLMIPGDSHLVVRAEANGTWGPKAEAKFVIDVPANLEITEVHYNPADATDAVISVQYPNKDDFEFIELFNPTGVPIRQVGASLAGGINATLPYFELGAGERGVIVRDREAFERRYGTGIKILGEYTGRLANGGDQIILASSNGTILFDFVYNDGDAWPQLADGLGASLAATDLAGLVGYSSPDAWESSGEYNGTPGAAAGPKYLDVVINEVLTHTDLPDVDAIELRNLTSQPVDISGWYLSDSAGNYLKFRIPNGTILPGGGYVVFDECDFNVSGLTPDPADDVETDFALNSAGDDVWLMAADAPGNLTRFAHHVEFDGAFNGMSLGFGTGAVNALTLMASPTLGDVNSKHFSSPVMIGEVHYHPDDVDDVDEADLEFLELYNRSRDDVRLDYYDVNGNGQQDADEVGGWKFTDGVEFEFAPGTVIASDSVLLMVGFDPTDAAKLNAFMNAYGIGGLVPGVDIVGGWIGRLANGGERLELAAPDTMAPGDTEPAYVVLDAVNYDDAAPWPTDPDGDDESLNRYSVRPYGNDPDEWIDEVPTPGATVLVVVSIEGDFNDDGIVDDTDIDLLQAGVRNTTLPKYDLDSSGSNDYDDVIYLVEVVIGTVMGDLNLDGAIDLVDFIAIKKGFAAPGGWAEGDITGDGLVSIDDFVAFKKAYATGVSAPAALSVATNSTAAEPADDNGETQAPPVVDATAPIAAGDSVTADVLVTAAPSPMIDPTVSLSPAATAETLVLRRAVVGYDPASDTDEAVDLLGLTPVLPII